MCDRERPWFVRRGHTNTPANKKPRPGREEIHRRKPFEIRRRWHIHRSPGGKPGNPAGDKFCGAENGGVNHANCADGFDNNGNGQFDVEHETKRLLGKIDVRVLEFDVQE